MAVDQHLATLLKIAKRVPQEKALFFAVVVKGGSDGALVVARRKVPPKTIQEAKKRCGATAVFLGRCFLEDSKLLFETAKKPPGTLARLLRHVIARDAGLKWHVLVRHAENLTEEELAEGSNETAPQDGIPQVEQDGTVPAGQQQPGTHPAPKKFSPVTYGHARLLWDTTRKKAHGQLELLQMAILEYAANDPRLGEFRDKVKVLDNVLVNLDDGLSDKLDAALKAAGEERDRLHREAVQLVKKYLAYVESDQLLNGLDTNPFVPVTVRRDMAATLTTLAKNIGG